MRGVTPTSLGRRLRANFSGVADRERRFRKQRIATPTRLPRWGPRRSARQNASPTFVAHCHGARTRLGPRGGGRLRVLSTIALAPTSIVCCTGAPGRRRTRPSALRHNPTARRRRVAEANHRERRDVLRTWKRIGRREIRGPGAKYGLFDRRRHLAERCVSRVVELVRGSNPASPGGGTRTMRYVQSGRVGFVVAGLIRRLPEENSTAPPTVRPVLRR